jgi:microcystin-dependent protein
MSCTAADLINIQPLVLSDTFHTWFDRTNQIIESTNAINVYEVDVGATNGGLIKETGCSAGFYNGVVTLFVNPGAGIGIGVPDFTNNYNKVVIDAIRLEDLDGVTSSNPANDDYYIVSDVSDTRQGPAGTPKRVVASRILPSELDGNVTFNDDVYIRGNLSVDGEGTFIDTNDLRIEDKLIELAYQRYAEFMVQGSGLTEGTFVNGMTAFYSDSGNPLTAGPATTVGKVLGWSLTGSSPGTTGIIQISAFSEGGVEDIVIGGKLIVTGSSFEGIMDVTGSGVGIGEAFLTDAELQPSGLWIRGSESDKFFTWVCNADCGAENWNAFVSDKNLGVSGSDNWIISSKFASYGYCDSSVNNSFTYYGVGNSFTRYDVGQTLTMRHSPTGQAGITFGVVYTGSTGPAVYPGVPVTNWVQYFNADQLDGAHALTTATAWSIPVAIQNCHGEGRLHPDWVQADSIRKDYTQEGHGFVKGHVVRFDSDGSLTFAKANNVQNAEAIGIVSAVTGSCITVISKGYVSGITGTGGFAGIYPLVTGNAYFLSPVTNGGLIADPDSGALMLQPGEIRKAMFVASGFDSGYVVNYTGIVVGDNPTDLVYMRSAAPVGSVHPFAGLTSSVPYGWFVCDGSAKSKEEWPDLFDAIGNIHHADAVVGGNPDAMVMVGDTRGLQAGDAVKIVWPTGEVSTTIVSVNAGTRVVTIAGNDFADLPEGTELRVYGRVVASTTGRSIYFLPDLRRRTVFGTSFGTGLPGSGNVSPQLGIAAVGGDDQVELAIDNIPDHRHSLDMNVIQSPAGGYASSTDQTGDLIELGANGSPFSIMPPHISMHWIIRAKKGYQATILSGHNHDNFYIRYDISHTIEGGAARTLTDADRAQFRANAKVLRNDADDTFNGTLTVTGSMRVFNALSVSGSAHVVGGLSADNIITNDAFINNSARIRLGSGRELNITGASNSTVRMFPALNYGLTGANRLYDQNQNDADSRNLVVDSKTGEVTCRPMFNVSTTAPAANTASQYPEGFVWYRTGSAVGFGPKFITPVTIYTGADPIAAFSNSLISVPPQVPTTATALILDTEILQYQPDGNVANSVFETSVLVSNNRNDRYKIGANRSSGKGDTVANVCQATIPFNTTARNFYLHMTSLIRGTAVIRIVGYY